MAAAIAKIYGAVAAGGQELDINPDIMEALITPAVSPTLGCRDIILKMNTLYSFEFLKPCSSFQFDCNDKAFGTYGPGGSFGFADPELQIGYAYVMNKPEFQIFDNPRELALRKGGCIGVSRECRRAGTIICPNKQLFCFQSYLTVKTPSSLLLKLA